MSESEDTISNRCESLERRLISLRLAVSAARQDSRQELRRDAAPLSRAESVSQDEETEGNENRRFQKRYKVVTGPARRRYTRKFCRGFPRPPRANDTEQRQLRDRVSERVSRMLSVMSEEEKINWRDNLVSYIKSIKTLNQSLHDRVDDVTAAIALAERAPADATPHLAAAAHAQVESLEKMFEIIQMLDESGINELGF